MKSLAVTNHPRPPALLEEERTSRPSLTAELFVIPRERFYLVFAPLRRAAFVAGAGVVNLLARLQSGHCDAAEPGAGDWLEFLRGLGIVDGGHEPAPVTRHSGPPKPTMVSLFLTTACNLRCTYCYASAGENAPRAMSLAVAKRGIDFVIGNAKELGSAEIGISYHGGGEPTRNWETLVASHAYANERAAAENLQVDASLTTNGVLSDDRLDWIVGHLDGLSVSYDGLPEVHDRHRVDRHGRGTSAAVLKTLGRLEAEQFPYGLRLTVTRDDLPRMAASVRYVCEHFHPVRIVIEPAFRMGRWKTAPSAETGEFIAGFREARAEARKRGQELIYSGVRLDVLSNHFCGASQDGFGLTAEGVVSGCYETFMPENRWSRVFHYGRMGSENEAAFEFDYARLEHLRRSTVENLEFCRGCFARWTCSGDCYHKALEGGPDGGRQGSERCHITRELTIDEILDRIQRSGGLFWQDTSANSPGDTP